MKLSRHLYAPLALITLMGACHKSDDGPAAPAPPAPKPTATASGTVSTGTGTSVTAGGTTLTVPADSATALLTASGNKPVEVAMAQNDTSKQDAAALATLGNLPSGDVATAVWVIDAKVASPIAPPEAGPSGSPAAMAMTTAPFEIVTPDVAGRYYRAAYSLDGGKTYTLVSVTPQSGRIRFVVTFSTFPFRVLVREVWSTTGASGGQ